MKQNLTEIVAILDRSGSMRGLEKDVLGGFNNFIDEQKKIDGEANVTMVLFDDQYEKPFDHVNLKSMPVLDEKMYFVRGWTALYDAMGKTINSIGHRLASTPEADRPSKVIFLIITDGAENRSTEFSYFKLKEMIEHQQSKYSWQFIFLSANLESFDAAKGMGIINTYMYNNTQQGTRDLYAAVNCCVSSVRNTGEVNDADLAKLSQTQS